MDSDVALDHGHGLGVDVGMAEAATEIGFLSTAFLFIFLAGEQTEAEVERGSFQRGGSSGTRGG